ncbi:MAG TPA: hypothetical protein VHB77_22595 [Planctomycetaceae bacterium]|nr:hypothetical protein [Planctomycetaceae bacterium]
MYARLLTVWLGLAGFLCLGVVEAADKSLKETPSGSKSLKENSDSSSSKKPAKIGDAPDAKKKIGKRELQQQQFKAWLLKTYDKNKNGKMDESERNARLKDLANARNKAYAQWQASQMRGMGGGSSRMGRMHYRR